VGLYTRVLILHTKEVNMVAQLHNCPICGEQFFGDTYYCSRDCEAVAKQEDDELAEGWEEMSNAENPCY
jgi:hypothetical protein